MTRRRDNLVPGTLTVLILKAVEVGSGHGYGISRWIQRVSGDRLKMEEGVLYPALHNLEADGCLTSEWGTNDTGRRAKFYALTPRGRRRLRAEAEEWSRSARAVFTVLETDGPGGP